MQGAGNDFIMLSASGEPDNAPAIARCMCDRHFGVGGDGLVFILPSSIADAKMVLYNSDGSQALMCGNAIRCVGKYLYDNRLLNKTNITVETASGVKALTLGIIDGRVNNATVNMGEPIFAPEKIPMLFEGDSFISEKLQVCGKTLHGTALSMGNPHLVIFEDELGEIDFERNGACFENHPLFPGRVNTEIISIDMNIITAKVWERGCGITLSCGTGACAALVAANRCGRCGRSATVRLSGGTLHVKWNENDNCVYLTGNAVHIFDGEIIF